MNLGKVEARLLDERHHLPFLVRASDRLDTLSWASDNRTHLRSLLHEHGAILFRGFKCNTLAAFNAIVSAICGSPLPYTEQSSPRTHVSDNVYTSTEYPADETIFLHNEQSYNTRFIRYIAFGCLAASKTGGETPIADCRAVFNRIDPELRRKLIERKYMYVRNYRPGLGLPWTRVFGTTDKAAVEAYCREHEIDYEWTHSGSRLRTRQVRRVAGIVPGTSTWT